MKIYNNEEEIFEEESKNEQLADTLDLLQTTLNELEIPRTKVDFTATNNLLEQIKGKIKETKPINWNPLLTAISNINIPEVDLSEIEFILQELVKKELPETLKVEDLPTEYDLTEDTIEKLQDAFKSATSSIKIYGSGGGTNNDILQQIADNTDTLELKADQINLNTDEIESKLDTLETDKALASKQLPNDHDVTVSNQITGFSTLSKQDSIKDAIDNLGEVILRYRGTNTTIDTNYEYMGYEEVGGGKWEIMRFTVADESEVKFAEGNTDFSTAWNDPTLLTYN